MTASERIYPTIDEQYDLLVATGNQFDEQARMSRWRTLGDLQLPSEENGALEPALYDYGTVPRVGRMVVSSAAVREQLQIVRPGLDTDANIGSFVDGLMSKAGVIIGFSGYGTGGGYGYEVEADAIQEIMVECEEYLSLHTVIDGGTGFGTPGLSGVIAGQRGHERIGYLPMRSLRGLAPRDTSVVVGKEFGDEAKALGASPDILFVAGGGPNASLEVDAAIDAGASVVLLDLKSYPASSTVYRPIVGEAAEKAHDEGRLVTCIDLEEVAEYIQSSDLQQLIATRPVRRLALGDALLGIER